MQKPVLIFDFDGTLANTLPLLIEIYNGIAEDFGCKRVASEDIDDLRGRRPQEYLKEYGLTWWKLPRVALAVRTELKEKRASVELHAGIEEMIRSLSERFTLGISTSNSEENTQVILQRYNLDKNFSFIHSGRNIFGKHKILNKLKVQYGEIVYTGDETRDIEAAKKSGVKSIGVTWGFNTENAIVNAEPDIIMYSPAEMEKYG